MSDIPIDKTLELANLQIKQGKIADAHALFKQVLEAASDNFEEGSEGGRSLVLKDFSEVANPPERFISYLRELYNNFDYEKVITESQLAIQNYPNAFDIWNLMGASYAKIDQFDKAIIAFENLIELKPDFVEGYHNIAIAYKNVGMFEKAVSAYRAFLSSKPNHFDAQINLGKILHFQGKLSEAADVYRTVITLEQNYEEAYRQLGSVLKLQGQFVESTYAYERLLDLNPYDADAFNELGAVLTERKLFDEAISTFNSAILLDPDYEEAHNNLGAVLAELDRVNEALLHYSKALSLNPDYIEAYLNLGIALTKKGRLDEAIDAYKDALSLKPDYAEARYNLGRVHWLQNNFQRAFELLEWRWLGEPKFIGRQYESSKPSWDGSKNSEVFVWSEQGVGDEIMFGSMLLELNECCSKLTVECDKRLIPLYKRSFPKSIKFLDDRHKIDESDYVSHVAIGSLPKYFRHSRGDFSPTSSGWLKADRKKTEAFRERLRSSQVDKVVGISWFTNGTGQESLRRNLPLDTLIEYLKPVQATFVNLQYGDTCEELSNIEKATGIEIVDISDIDIFNDLDTLASLISACDVVVSIDNSTVHLAGALGVDTRVLLPKIPDERWGLESKDSYWYDNLTLYRQEVQGDWSEPLHKLIEDITNLPSTP